MVSMKVPFLLLSSSLGLSNIAGKLDEAEEIFDVVFPSSELNLFDAPRRIFPVRHR